MEITKLEIASLEVVAGEKSVSVLELDSLELALVGGGMGDIVLHCH
jgi:hypothetical protein